MISAQVGLLSAKNRVISMNYGGRYNYNSDDGQQQGQPRKGGDRGGQHGWRGQNGDLNTYGWLYNTSGGESRGGYDMVGHPHARRDEYNLGVEHQ
jgi:hypothetical protein